jgi:hypothetical protein
MNKKLSLFIATIVAITVWNINLSFKGTILPNGVLQNIEALTEESGSGVVHVCPRAGSSCTVVIGDGQTSTTVHGWQS